MRRPGAEPSRISMNADTPHAAPLREDWLPRRALVLGLARSGRAAAATGT